MKKAKMRRRFCVWVVASGLVLSWSVLCTGDFYVIPVKSGGECTGDATVGDVLVGKTFSNSTATGLTGTRAHAPVEKTGQTTSSATGDDGDLHKGVAWPSPRFTANVDNNGDGDCVDPGETCDGTVTDNLTGLIWLKNANCPGTAKNWSDALTYANSLYDGWSGDPGGGDCGLSDGSSAGDWRLPNIKELLSLIDFGNVGPALPSGHPFTGVVSAYYWSSTSEPVYLVLAWFVGLTYGDGGITMKDGGLYVWPVRGGQ